MSAARSLTVRARIIVAGLIVAGLGLGGLGLGEVPDASASPAVPASAAAVPVLKIAATYQGVPYRWGGTSTRGFDCSGYVQFVFKQLGVKLPRTAEQQYEATRHIKASQLQVGDLVFYGNPGAVYHVGIYAGHGKFWDAPHTGSHVKLQTIWAGRKVYGRVRGLPSALVVAPTTAPSQLPIVLSSPVAIFPAPTASATPTTASPTDPMASPAATASAAGPTATAAP